MTYGLIDINKHVIIEEHKELFKLFQYFVLNRIITDTENVLLHDALKSHLRLFIFKYAVQETCRSAINDAKSHK